MQDKLKESVSKSEHFAQLFAERERELQFFSSGHESQGEFFFLRGHGSQGAGQFSKVFSFC